MYRTTKLLLSIIVLSILSGCSTTDLAYKNNKLALQVDGKHLQVNGTSLGHHQNNFSSLYLTHNILRLDAGNIVVYEKARTDNRYEFNFPAMTTIQIVFDAKEVRKVYFSSSFYILQLVLQNSRILNTVVEQLEDQSMNITYGMSTKQINNLLRQLDAKASRPLKENVITIQHKQGAILSRWSDKKVHFVPLIVPIREFGL